MEQVGRRHKVRRVDLRLHRDIVRSCARGRADLDSLEIERRIENGLAEACVGPDFTVSFSCDYQPEAQDVVCRPAGAIPHLVPRLPMLCAPVHPVPVVDVYHFAGTLNAWRANFAEWTQVVCDTYGIDNFQIRWKGRAGWARLLERMRGEQWAA